MRNSVYGTNCVSSSNSNYMNNKNNNKIYDHTDLFKKASSTCSNKDNYLDKEKIAAAASAAAEAVANAADANAAFQRENKERDYLSMGSSSVGSSSGNGVLNFMQNNNSNTNNSCNSNKSINNFYNLTKNQIESLQVSFFF